MEFKISNFNIMSDKHFDFFTWDEVGKGDGNINREPEDSMNNRYNQVMRVIGQINVLEGIRNPEEEIDVMTFQEVTEHSIKKLAEYATNLDYKLYQNKIISKDRPLLLATMIKNTLVNAYDDNIIDLTDNYQNFYNRNNYNSRKDSYFPGRAQVFYIRSKNLIVVNVHAPGDPNGFTRKLWWKSISAFIRCGCHINQIKSKYCYPDNQNVKIILIGDFNISDKGKDKGKLEDWTNEGDILPKLELFKDNRNTSYHSGIKETVVEKVEEKLEKKDKWKPDEDPYQKVDHLMKTNNLGDPFLYIYVSKNFDNNKLNFHTENIIDNKIIPYQRKPSLIMDAPNSDPKMDDGSVNPNYDIKNAAPLEEGKNVGDWEPNFDIGRGGWPSDHTFNLYVFPNIPDIRNPLRGGGSSKEKRRYKIIY